MPEEINRVVADHLSELLLCPSATAVQNLAAEGIAANVHVTGDVMLDVLNWAQQRVAGDSCERVARFGLKCGAFVLATVHRSENTDDPERLSRVLSAFRAIEDTVLFAVHPRTRKAIAALGCPVAPNVRLVDPLGYLDMVAVTRAARLVLTDSGGLQKEAYWLGVPCVTLRDETEWVETVDVGWNTLVGADPQQIVEAVRTFAPPAARPPLYGDGNAAGKCVALLQ